MPHKRAKRSVRLSETAKKGSNLPPSSSSFDDAPRSAMRIINSLSVQSKFREGGKRTSEDTGERRPKPKSKSQDLVPGASGSKNLTLSTQAKTSQKDVNGSTTSTKGKEKESIPKIMPHETLGEYNRRIESLLRPGVSQAIKSANQRKSEQIRDAEREKIERKRKAKALGQGKPASPPPAAPSKSAAVVDGGKSGGKKRKHDVEDAERTFKEAGGPRRLNDIAQAPPSLPSLRHAGKDGKSESVWSAKGKGKSGLSAAQERILGEERERVIKRYREIKAGKEAEKEAERDAAAGGKKKRKKVEDEA